VEAESKVEICAKKGAKSPTKMGFAFRLFAQGDCALRRTAPFCDAPFRDAPFRKTNKQELQLQPVRGISASTLQNYHRIPEIASSKRFN
jgi:hypothetical protein